MTPGFSIAEHGTIESVADRWGVKVAARSFVRVQIQYRSQLEGWVRSTRRTGTLSVNFSQGTATSCGWEETS